MSKVNLPKYYYNLKADLPELPPPPLHPFTGQPISPADLESLFPKSLIEQEISTERFIEIPEKVREAYAEYRPTPLKRAKKLEKYLNTPARIYFKYEGTNASGSHKLNTALAQAYFNKLDGTEQLTTETGAGQWGSALAYAANFFGLKLTVYMVGISYDQKPYRRIFMETFGARVVKSPSPETAAGRKVLEADPNSPGSLGIAISEAVEVAMSDPKTKYALGSVLDHVLLHQTVIGQEVYEELSLLGEKPDVLIACVGGGSNFGGFTFPFVREKLKGENIEIIAVEPKACPTLTEGEYKYDFGDVAGLTPKMPMYTLGYDFIPPGIHAGGLRYHGDSPLVSLLYKNKIISAKAYPQLKVFEAGVTFARTEGIIPAPESSHAIAAAIDEAIKCREESVAKTIVFNLSGHGYFDLSAYEAYFAGKLKD
ncbi:TrpB-like pyridoxal phosphate-dependent enzyme [Carboxydothermus hydrogenoformans]|uniref:Tryptophan synthase beta chain n=1 Tax=Carboxydothermus hydrogenoformans (strain ATCC BAA-161 / DSM 6008 / Z-2901) TaxID=246194 RepID=Q3AE29_CARHZ|nr:TrpB-like pyridoxal phosphate-dependent enzyme [Carboxydothermus hydrogenoformans]ABB15222.1 putative tryptophan synthase, beta subunit [Carboxydothermus hydrogenoformans Z-2901]